MAWRSGRKDCYARSLLLETESPDTAIVSMSYPFVLDSKRPRERHTVHLILRKRGHDCWQLQDHNSARRFAGICIFTSTRLTNGWSQVMNVRCGCAALMYTRRRATPYRPLVRYAGIFPIFVSHVGISDSRSCLSDGSVPDRSHSFGGFSLVSCNFNSARALLLRLLDAGLARRRRIRVFSVGAARGRGSCYCRVHFFDSSDFACRAS